jgi:hypothetical protein
MGCLMFFMLGGLSVAMGIYMGTLVSYYGVCHTNGWISGCLREQFCSFGDDIPIMNLW